MGSYIGPAKQTGYASANTLVTDRQAPLSSAARVTYIGEKRSSLDSISLPFPEKLKYHNFKN
jgi:hypothetical protein